MASKHEWVFNERHRAFLLRLSPRRMSSVALTEESFDHVPYLDDADRMVEALGTICPGAMLYVVGRSVFMSKLMCGPIDLID